MSQPSIPSIHPNDYSLEQAFKQFSLETERLELTYHHLQDRFQSIQTTLQDSNTRLAGKMAELDFLSRYLETILDHISQGIIFIDSNGIVTTYNAAAQQILQIPEKELFFHQYHERLEDRFFGFSIKEAFVTKQCPKSTFLTWNRQGKEIELEIESTFVTMNKNSLPVAHRSGSPLSVQGLLVLFRDATSFRRLQRLANRNERLKDLGELAIQVAHKIRNPLGGIKGFAALLSQELQDRPDLQQMASYIIQGSDDLNQFVSHILQYTRPHSLHLENIDVVQLIQEIKELMQVDPSWNPHIDFTIQSLEPKLTVPIDVQMVKSSLLNLFMNAAQAMPNGGRLSVKIEAETTFATISITDTGIGIEPENISKIFSPFFTTKEAGNGLGLAEVNQTIQAHQGWIEVESEPGKGSTFTLKFPFKQGE